jgi:hypothetical protein
MHCSNARDSAGNGVTRESIASWAICGVIRVTDIFANYTNVLLRRGC